MTRTIWTIGHSVHPPEEFARLAANHYITTIIDVRSHPTSRWEWFRREEMEDWLPRAGLRYEWWPELGGWDVRHAEDAELRSRMADVGVNLTAYARGHFPKQRIGAQRPRSTDTEPVWTNQGLYDYAWFTTLPEFEGGIERLIDRADHPETPNERVAIMCCEALWWKCHRSMVSDVLVARGREVSHAPGGCSSRKAASHRAVLGNRLERYPLAVRQSWAFEQLELTP